MCFHVRPQIAYSAVSAQAAIIFAIEAIDGGLFGFRIGTVNGDGGMRGLIRHKTGITRIDVHVNLIRRYCVMDVAVNIMRYKQVLFFTLNILYKNCF